MKGRMTMVLVIALALMVPALLMGGDAEAGKAAYGKKCATCHGADGAGKAAIAKMMKVEFKHLGSEEVQSLSDADLTKIVKEGKDKMKPVPGVSDEDVANIIAYVRTMKKM